jgi:DNA repair exonuclease SbcCD ATPase subunit
MAGAARGVPDSISPPILEVPYVILGRRLQTGAGPETALPPLPLVLSRAHQALRETEAAILREWEALEAKHQRLGDWHTQLEERTKAASYQFASERSDLEQGREDLKEDMKKVLEREQKATQEEKRLVEKKEHLDQRDAVITKFHEKFKAYNAMLEKQRDEQTAIEAALQKLQQELDDRASNISLAEENLKAKDVSLEERATDLIRQEKDLAWREEMWERRDKLLAEHELEVEEKEKKLEEKEWTLEERVRRFQAVQAAQVAQTVQAAPGSQATEMMREALEDLRAEHRIGVQRIAAWADEASSALVPLGVSPIPVSKQSVSISDALSVLDSTADRLRRLDQILGARLEAEGSRLYRAVIEYILTCFLSYDPAFSLGPVIVGPVADTEDVARGSVQDAVDVVAKRFQRDPTDDE